MPAKQIVTQQNVTPAKYSRAKDMRREMTQAERILWHRLKADRLQSFHFRRQQVIEPYIVDFYCHQAGLVVEADGEVHLEQAEYDALRDQNLKSRGIHVLRVTNDAILHD